jgi:hypothetical protein
MPARFDPSPCLYKALPLLSFYPFFLPPIAPPGRRNFSP